MNDTVDTDNQDAGGLKGSFGDRGLNVNAMGYGHPHGDNILAELDEMVAEAECGRLLLKAKAKGNIPVSIMKGDGEAGFSADMKSIVIQIPGKIKSANHKYLLQYVKALREADHFLMGYKLPDPNEDIMEYATVMHIKNIDSITYVCKFVKELTNSSDFSVLLDVISQMGYKEVYETYARDGSQEEIFKAYSGQ